MKKRFFVLTVLVSSAASIGGLVRSGVRLRLRVSSLSGPASFCGVLASSSLVSRAEFEYCADIYRAQYTRVSTGRLGYSRGDILYVQDVSAKGAETARRYTSVLRSVYAGAVFKFSAGKRVSAYTAHPRFCPDFQGKIVRGIRR